MEDILEIHRAAKVQNCRGEGTTLAVSVPDRSAFGVLDSDDLAALCIQK